MDAIVCDKHDRRVNTRPELAAIDNLPQYAVVGTLEDLRASLSVLAARLPAFFGPPFDYRPYASVHLNAFGESAGRKQRHERLNATELRTLTRAGGPLFAGRQLYNRVASNLECQSRACARAAGRGGSRSVAAALE